MNLLDSFSLLTFYLAKINIFLCIIINLKQQKVYISKSGVIISFILIICLSYISFRIIFVLGFEYVSLLIHRIVLKYVFFTTFFSLFVIVYSSLILQLYNRSNFIKIINKIFELLNSVKIIRLKNELLLNQSVKNIIKRNIVIFILEIIQIIRFLFSMILVLQLYNNIDIIFISITHIYNNLIIHNISRIITTASLIIANLLFNMNSYLENILKSLKNLNKNENCNEIKAAILIELENKSAHICNIYYEISYISSEITNIFQLKIILFLIFALLNGISNGYCLYHYVFNDNHFDLGFVFDELVLIGSLFSIFESLESVRLQQKNARKILMLILFEIRQQNDQLIKNVSTFKNIEIKIN